MQSIDLIRQDLERSEALVLLDVEDLRETRASTRVLLESHSENDLDPLRAAARRGTG
jgi:hypothetical protein